MAEKNTHEITLSGCKASCKETSLVERGREKSAGGIKHKAEPHPENSDGNFFENGEVRGMTYEERVAWLMRYRTQTAKVTALRREYKQKQAILKELDDGESPAAARLPRTEAALQEAQRQALQLFDEIDAAIDALENCEVRIVLREIYLAGSSQEAVAFTQHMGKRAVGQKHKAGVMALEIAENEKSFSGRKPEKRKEIKI